MRSLEILVVVVNLVTIVLMVVPLRHAARWLCLSAILAAPVTGAQLVVEGPRWQMVPAYTLGGLLLLSWLLQTVKPTGRRGGRGLAHRIAIGVCVGLGLLLLAASVALPVLVPVFQFPRPDGPYAIGTVTYHWVDKGRHEIFSNDPDALRELMAQVWYPAKPNSSSARAPYVQNASALSSAEARVLHLPGFTFDYWADVPTDAMPSVPLAAGQPSYPVLIFLSGLSGFRQSNTFQVEELVSHGYIVVGLDQPYAAGSVVFPDGRRVDVFSPRGQMQPLIEQSINPTSRAPVLNGEALQNGIIPYFAEDVSFVLDELNALDEADPKGVLTGRLDLQRVGTFGVSLGAMVAAEACHLDPRLKACLMMDAAMPADVVQAGLPQPSMWITRDASSMRLERQRTGGWSEAQIHETLMTMRAAFAKSPPGNGYYVQVDGMFHVDFTDAPSWTPLASQLGLAGPTDGQRGHDIVNAYSNAFFDQHLEGLPSALLDGPPKQYPEVFFAAR